jgi:hypothetical protein
MMQPPFVKGAAMSGNEGQATLVGPGPAGVDPEHEEGAAPAGKLFTEAELPIRALGESTGSPATLNGFTATAAHDGIGVPPEKGLDYPKPATEKTR